ncbi:MAG: 2-dehydro-3-deoxy-6-phosphogalactonate aldolase [Alphaproteobacteria bacterium PA4]|nr:MAG: 2-dehydro-3-deoxy-6-phosphogalactonate aldolase [Alphaproteobacteria bacterium PA4]
MTAPHDFAAHLAACPLVAILRGVRPDEVEAIGTVLLDAGIRIIEVPLNSPDPFASITRLSGLAAGRALVGAGTVLDGDAVARVAAAGGQVIVSPNTDTAVISASVAAGLVSLPGFFTPSEAFAALAAGAHGLKLFPAEAATPAVLKALRAVLPPATPVLAVGGITADGMSAWTTAGAAGFGLGSGLYKPGMTAAAVGEAARRYVAAIAGVSS